MSDHLESAERAVCGAIEHVAAGVRSDRAGPEDSDLAERASVAKTAAEALAAVKHGPQGGRLDRSDDYDYRYRSVVETHYHEHPHRIAEGTPAGFRAPESGSTADDLTREMPLPPGEPGEPY